MEVMNTIINDMFDRIATKAGNLAKYNKKILGKWEIQTACRLVFLKELGRHAVSEGTKATARPCGRPYPKGILRILA